MYEITEKNLRYRKFYAKNKKRDKNGRFKKEHKVEAGIIIVTCLDNQKQYIAHSLNVWEQYSRVINRMRRVDTNNVDLDADIRQYGLKRFRVGVGETLPVIAGEPREDTMKRLHTLFASHVKGKTNLYNKREVLVRGVPVIERKSIEDLGKTQGKTTQPIACACVFVITCKSTLKYYVGYTTDFERLWWRITAELRKGYYFQEELQGEWNEFGPSKFTCEFVRLPEPDLRSTKKIVSSRLGNLYSNKGRSSA